MNADAKPYEQLTETGIKKALVEARGDIFVASQLLGVTAIRLDRAIRVSTALQAVTVTLADAKQDAAFERLSTQDLGRAVERRLALYRVAGLDALHDLATMPIDDNSAQNQVKLSAAARLAGTVDAGSGGGELAETLRELNQLYHQEAPRIRVTREKTTVEIAPPEHRVVSEQ